MVQCPKHQKSYRVLLKAQFLSSSLFIHINDFSNTISTDIRLFADNCVFFSEINYFNYCQILQEDIDELGHWADTWGMKFKAVKCNMMTRSKKKKAVKLNYKFKGTTLELLTFIKYLGVNITNNIYWGMHITEVCNKLSES